MNDTPNTDNGSKRSYILKAWEELGIKIKKNDCSYDRPWDVDILLYRLCFCLSRLLWNHSGQRPNDHSGGKSPSWHLQMFLRFLFVFTLWHGLCGVELSKHFSLESQISLIMILLYPKEWLGYYGVIISNNEIGVNFVQGVSMDLLREWLWTMREMLSNFLRGMRGRFGVQRRRRWLVFFFFQQSVSFSCPNFENPTIMMILLFMIGMIHKIVTNLPRRSQAKEVKKASIMEKTKKNVALEASLFRLLIQNPAWRKNWKLFFQSRGYWIHLLQCLLLDAKQDLLRTNLSK